MKVVDFFFDSLMIFIECFVWWRLMSSVLNARYHKKYMAYAAVGLFVLIQLKGIVFSLPGLGQYRGFGTLVFMIYNLIILIILYKNSFLEKLVWWGVYNFILIITESITVILLNLVFHKPLDAMMNDATSEYIVLICKLLLIPLFEWIIRRRKGRLVIGVSYYKELMAVILLNAILMICVVYIFHNKQIVIDRTDQVVMFVFGVVLFITVYTVILIFRLERKSREDLETQLKLQQAELELKLYDDINVITDKLRKLRHDMNNHIGLIKALVLTQKYEELKEYIDQVYEDVETANDLVVSGNQTVSVLINAKKALAKSKNIEFNSVIVAQDIQMQSKDISSLLGNILDNAIEAAEKTSGKKYVEFMIQNTEEGCIISCENSLGTKPIMKKGKFKSLKKDSSFHGIGTENIRDIVSKYQGHINFDYDDEMFSVRVVIPV